MRCHFLNLSSIDLPSAKAYQVKKVIAYLSQINPRPAPWMARAYNPVGRAREARLQNMGLTCDASLARNLPSSEPSRLRDRPRSQVEAVVLQVPASRSSEPWTARTICLH